MRFKIKNLRSGIKNQGSRILLFITICHLLFAVYFIPVNAQIATLSFETNPALVGNATRQIQKSVLEIAFGALKKRVFDLMVDQIIDYINGNGQPQFITDWRAFLETIGQVAVGDLVQQLGLGYLCSPFQLQVQLAMVAPPRFSKQVTCTLGTIIQNVNNFYSDFRNGSWLVYQEMWAPNNNFYGALLLAWNAKENEIAARVNAAQSEAMASQGFLSVKKCLKDANGRDIPHTCVITTPGTAVGALAQKAISSDLDFIINSQDLAAYIAAISDALLNRLIRSGVEGLRGITTPTNPPTNSANLIGCENLLGRAKRDCEKYINDYGFTPDKQKKITPVQINGALQPRLTAQQILQTLISLEERVVDQLSTLTSCQISHGLNSQGVELILIQHQQNLDRYYQVSYDNDYFISQLLVAAEELRNSPNNSFATLALTPDMIDADAANLFLISQQTEQNINLPILTELNNNLPTQINQCQQL